jgi:DNA-binding CsgD family transcriptional regulator/GAF domain-containing protein
MLRSHDLKDVIRIGSAALACSGVDDLRHQVVALLPEAFQTERVCFYLAHKFPCFRIDLYNLVSKGVDPSFMDIYRQHFQKVDPLYKKSVESSDSVLIMSDTISRKDFMLSEYYNDFLKPQSIAYQMAIHLKSSGGLLGVVVLARSGDEREFSEREKAKAETIAPSLAAALERVTFLDKLAKSSELISSIGPELPYEGVIVLDESMEPLFVNEQARRSLAALAESTEPAENPLFDLPEQLQTQLEDLLIVAKRERDGAVKREFSILNKKTGQTVSYKLSVEYEFRGSRLCVIGVGQDKRSDNLKAWGLTRRESEIVGLVCQGHKNNEIAEKLFISEATVENHLHSIFEKVGVKNRASLIYRAGNVHTK